MSVPANIVTEKDGIPVMFDGIKRGFVIRVVHSQNPKAPSKNLSVTLLYLAPGGSIAPHHHENEEVYIILQGQGKGFFGMSEPVPVAPGTFFHLPANAEHGLENTGDDFMKVLITTAPPFGIVPEWGSAPDEK
ncbi:MAG: cupin domain-containing protein [Thaumarchaeota archaeon]|nr:cupin domain-containing protein [Nitrososphaerota archaeon]